MTRVLWLALLFALPSFAPCAESPADPSGAWLVTCDRTATDWQPAVLTGVMHLARSANGWRGDIGFHQTSDRQALTSLTVDGSGATLTFALDGPAIELKVSADELQGRMRWSDMEWSPFAARRVAPLEPGSMPHSLPAGQPMAGLDPAAWRTMEATAADEESTAVVVVKDGRVVAERYAKGYDGKPLVAMSASKSVVSMAVGCLVAEGKLTLDTRIATLFPEWKGTPKEAITVRHLLNHTSGLDQNRRNHSTQTIRAHALASPLVFAPGSRFQYNNNAVDFLAVVVKEASGIPLDEYLEARIFRKLNIKGAWWHKDPEATPLGAGELNIRPVDLAKLGQLMLDGGAWNGEQLLPREWVELSPEPAQEHSEDCGLLWWRDGTFGLRYTGSIFQAWRDIGMEESALAPALSLLGQIFPSSAEARAALEKAIGELAHAKLRSLIQKHNHVPIMYSTATGPSWGFSARGWLGQQLIVYPAARLVAVRMRIPRPADYEGGTEVAGYRNFASDVAKLVPSAPGVPAASHAPARPVGPTSP